MRSHIKLLLTTLLLLTSAAEARENPFAPVDQHGGEPLTKPIPAPDFQQESVPAPVISQAKCRVKEPVRNVVATQPATQTWEEVQSVTEPQKPKKKKPILFVKKRSVTPKHRLHHKAVKHHHVKRKVYAKPKQRLIYSNANLKIYTLANRLKIVTDDCIIQDFRLRKPERLVLDFGDDFVLYDTIRKTIRSHYVKMLKIGTHDRFYRLTFVLSGDYRYRIKKYSDGYRITFLR